MLLKKLIVSGFKSFADKVTLHFDDGITGIVGPNGSGKSNVIDAVRWVMGEQNAKHLRGQVATDIIFAGSDKRKALGMAEVTLVFDNSNASSFCPPEYRHEPEISLTRRLYIDGQREYLINKKPCRLKDIVGFFATTGLGGRSYSMIQQGQVDRILNAKPEDVREILEEAAGTLVFKNRRTAANKKLDSAQENLSRVEDIVTELESRIGALKGQAETAEKWQSLTEEHRSKELQVFKYNHSFFGDKIKELEETWNSKSDDEVSIFTEITNIEAKVTQLQQQLAEADPEVERLHEQVAVLREQITRAEGAIEMSKLKISQSETRMLRLSEEIEEETSGHDEVKAQYTEALDKFESAKVDADEHQASMDSFREEVDQVDEAANVFAGRTQELEQEVKNIDLHLESNTVRCESIEKDRQRIVLDKNKLSERREELLVKVSDSGKSEEQYQLVLDEKQNGLDDHVQKKLDLEERISFMDDEINEKSRMKDNLKEEYLTKNARLISLKELEMSSIDVLSVKNKLVDYDSALSSVYLLAEEVTLNNNSESLSKELSASIEKWLEKLVVKSSDDFDKVRQFAKIESLGEFSLSVESLWSDYSDNELNAWSSANGLKPVSGYLEVRSGGNDKVSKLLSRLFIVDEGGDLLKVLSSDLPSGAVVFSCDGYVFSDQLNIKKTYENSSGLLSRRRELESLEESLIGLKDQLDTIEIDVLDSEELLSEERIQLRSVEDYINQRNRDAVQAIADVQSAKQSKEHHTSNLSNVDMQIDELSSRDVSLVDELASLGESRISLGTERENVIVELDNLKIESEEIIERRDEIKAMQQARELDAAKSQARSQALRDNFDQLESQISRIESSLARKREDYALAEEEIETSKVTEQQSIQEIETYVYEKDSIDEELIVRRERNSEVIDKLKEQEKELKNSREKQSSIQGAKSKLTVEKERAQNAIDNLIAQGVEKYSLDLGDLEVEFDEEFDLEKYGRQVSRLKSKIDGLGAINMMAIEEYEKLMERYDFLTGQKEEVIGSIMLLEEAISEIEETSREKFLATFHVINKNFQELFPVLFPTGEAKLELKEAEDGDVLNAGVEIMVRMPGKKPRSMNLYSGGEKALTAISLIFALLKTKPTPFCFLDEVDAPLDEANVGRYNLVLEKLSDRFQFIVITHNRRTMEVLDQLYGVTMQEGGVSTVIGVDMKKDIPDHLKKAFKEETA